MKPETKNNSKYCPLPGKYQGMHWQHRHDHHWKHDGRPPRHFFFMRILFLLVLTCIILTISFFFFGGLSWHGVLHAFWIVLMVMLCCAFLLKMFGPLRWLMKGVQEISSGNLDFQFPIHGRRGEINYLAGQFNQMVEHIKEMIHSKEQLLLDVSHELRSPLTRLKVALEMSPKSKLKDSMMQDVAEMEAMLAEILETERLKDPNGGLAMEPVDLSALLDETVKKYKTRRPGVKRVGNHLGLTVQADPARVKRVLQNVVENALKYSSGRKKPVELSLEEKEGFAYLSIRDYGVGILLEDQERVFEPFYRVDKSRTKETGGYGLGLSLCLAIMKAHGGEIELESEPGAGTTVILKFPSDFKSI